ncbi:iron-containing alcohol dehydrogenase [bacterium]|nr:iron-containing alcohol dehydrogenase [bacterium]
MVTKKIDYQPTKVDIFAVITLAGTASENNNGSVVTNTLTNQKVGVGIKNGVPKISFCDPKFTLTLSN